MTRFRAVLDAADAALRLGPRPVVLAAWHRAIGRRRARIILRDAVAPVGAWFTAGVPPPAPALPEADRRRVLAAAAAIQPAEWHGPFDPTRHALALDLFAPGDIRPVWERNRLAELPLLVQAARLGDGTALARANAWLDAWMAANPAFRGPNWACGQEAALRVLHLALALDLLGAAPTPAMRDLLRLHARRIEATPSYAAAQDNNHPISEAAGSFVLGLLLREPTRAAQGRRALIAALRRLVSPDGGFAPVSTGYHRLLLDTVAVAERLRRAQAAPPWPTDVTVRLAAASAWLRRLTDTATGATPALGHQDGSALADLPLAGAGDARGSVERAARLFEGVGGPAPTDPGCAWLGLTAPALPPPQPARWTAAGSMGWQAGTARALLRTGPLRFRPGHADLLHLELWDGPCAVLRDGGSGAYNPPAGRAWWHEHLTGVAAHNTVQFDEREAMPRVTRFLFARWPRMGRDAEGAWLRDHRGCTHRRRVSVDGRRWMIEDRVGGGFASLALRWRLATADWQLRPDGVVGAPARIVVAADVKLTIALEAGWVSPAYGQVVPAPVLVVRAAAPVRRLTTTIVLP